MTISTEILTKDQSDNPSEIFLIPEKRSRKGLWLVIVVVGIITTAILVSMYFTDGDGNLSKLKTTLVKHDDLIVEVTESGSLQTRKSIHYKSGIDERVTILQLIPEGTYISTEDVNDGRILAQLDKVPLEDKLAPQEKELLRSEALYTEALEEYGITKGQGKSDIAAGKLEVEFAAMDLERYLGKAFTGSIIQDLATDPNTILNVQSMLKDPNELGGASRQTYDQSRDKITLAKAKLKRSQDKVASTRKLYDVEYVSLMELEGDQLEVESCMVQYQQALTELELFLMYDFPKEAKRLFSKYKESLRGLDRIYAKTRAREAQARSRKAARDAEVKWSEERVNRLKRQIAACIIKATAAGLVIHASGRDIFQRIIPEEEIREGLTVRNGQKIITLPDTSQMLAQIGVRETSVHKVRTGQDARITVDAFPDRIYQGMVSHVSQLPDPQGPFNSALKVYLAQVDIVKPDELLKPGMSAKVEIIVEHLEDVLTIPIQCVMSQDDKRTCFVKTDEGIQERELVTGSFNKAFVQIIGGLVKGEAVIVNPIRYKQAESSKGSVRVVESKPLAANQL
ncbi:efflux RND transporter periplasmic adaptor subunit [Planctomycetota bacterium]